MSYKDISIKKSYETTGNKNQLLEEFYIPMLEQTTQYFRIAGFFSSSSLAIASKGIEGLIKNDGFMRLLVSPKLSEEDLRILSNNNFSFLSDSLSIFNDFDISQFSSLDNLQALAWLLANHRLDIRIVVDKNSGSSIFHQKIGIGYDTEGNLLSFSGSINESAQAWLSNIEEFKTFKSWEDGQVDYLLSDLSKFNSYWNNERPEIAKVYDLPTAISEKIIHAAPKDIMDLSIMRRYTSERKQKETTISLFPHQIEAVKKWENNNYQLMMEMATGTGKTRTSIGCMLKLLPKLENFAVIVATPQNTLSRQWKKDIEELGVCFDASKIIDGSNPKWKTDLEMTFLDLNSSMYRNAIFYTTHDTASSSNFLEIIKKCSGRTETMFVCDEVHAIGSEHQKEALLNLYKYRVGLSATPERMYDEEGTQLIRDYFGGNSFEFTIRDALDTINIYTGKPFLNQFYYHPILVDLNDDEAIKYNKLSKDIALLSNSDDLDATQQDMLDMLLIKRANILKNAANKLTVLEDLIISLNSKERIKDTIIFATDKQIDKVLNILANHSITRCKITESESASKKIGIRGNTEREEYITQFREGRVQVLVGIKCLDEGIDITNARIAILMASSTNPREYVQRVGRVIRPAKNKLRSHIYDLIVKPSGMGIAETRILEKEAKRAFSIAKNAVNYSEVIDFFERNGVKVDADK